MNVRILFLNIKESLFLSHITLKKHIMLLTLGKNTSFGGCLIVVYITNIFDKHFLNNGVPINSTFTVTLGL